MIYCKATA